MHKENKFDVVYLSENGEKLPVRFLDLANENTSEDCEERSVTWEEYESTK